MQHCIGYRKKKCTGMICEVKSEVIIYHTRVIIWHTCAVAIGRQLLFFSIYVHKTELSFQGDLCRQFMLMENIVLCF